MGEAIRLGDNCVKIGSGATPRGGKETYSSDGPFALIRSQNVYNDRFSRDGLAYISEQQAAQLRNVEVKEHDVLLNITGDSVARVCQVAKDVLPARVNQHVAIIRPTPHRIDPRFLRYFLVSPEMQHYMLAIAAAGATRNALTKGMIENFSIPDKPLSEQIAIAGILGALDDKIELNRQTNETLEALARAIFKDWFVDFGPTRAKQGGAAPYLAPEIWDLFPDRLDEEGKPEGWGTFTLDDVAYHRKGSINPSAFPDSVFEYYSLPAFDSGAEPVLEIGSSIKSNKTPIAAQGVLLSKLNPSIPRVWIPDPPGALSQICSTEFLVFEARPLANRELLYCLFTNDEFTAFLVSMATGTSNSHQRIPPKSLLCNAVIVGSTDVFRAFGESVRLMLQHALANRIQSRTLAQTRDLLLPKLMSGEIRLRDAERKIEDMT